jgi:hypothetical protein
MSIENEYDGLNYVNGTILIVTDDADINIVLSGVFGLNGFVHQVYYSRRGSKDS